jgi:hypothetical protein
MPLPQFEEKLRPGSKQFDSHSAIARRAETVLNFSLGQNKQGQPAGP